MRSCLQADFVSPAITPFTAPQFFDPMTWKAAIVSEEEARSGDSLVAKILQKTSSISDESTLAIEPPTTTSLPSIKSEKNQ